MGKLKTVKKSVYFSDQAMFDLTGPISFGAMGQLTLDTGDFMIASVACKKYTKFSSLEYLSSLYLPDVDAHNVNFYSKAARIVLAPDSQGGITEFLTKFSGTTVTSTSGTTLANKTIAYDLSPTASLFNVGDQYGITLEVIPGSGTLETLVYTVQPGDNNLGDVITNMIDFFNGGIFNQRYLFLNESDTALVIYGKTLGDNYSVQNGTFYDGVNTYPSVSIVVQEAVLPAMVKKKISYTLNPYTFKAGDSITLYLEATDMPGPYEINYTLTSLDLTVPDVLTNLTANLPTIISERYTFTVDVDTLTIEGKINGDNFVLYDLDTIIIDEIPADLSTKTFYYWDSSLKTWSISSDTEIYNNTFIEAVQNVNSFEQLTNAKGFYFKLYIDNSKLDTSNSSIDIFSIDFEGSILKQPQVYFTNIQNSMGLPLRSRTRNTYLNSIVDTAKKQTPYRLLANLIIDFEGIDRDWRGTEVFWRVPQVTEEFVKVPLYPYGNLIDFTEYEWLTSVRDAKMDPSYFDVEGSLYDVEVRIVDVDGVITESKTILRLLKHVQPKIVEDLLTGVDTYEIPVGNSANSIVTFSVTKSNPDLYKGLVLGDYVYFNQPSGYSNTFQLKTITDSNLEFWGLLTSFDLDSPLFMKKTFEQGYDFKDCLEIPVGNFSVSNSIDLSFDLSLLGKFNRGDAFRVAQLKIDGTGYTTVDFRVENFYSSDLTSNLDQLESSSEPCIVNSNPILYNDSLSRYPNPILFTTRPIFLVTLDPNDHYKQIGSDLYTTFTSVIRPFRHISNIVLYEGASLYEVQIYRTHHHIPLKIFNNLSSLPDLLDEIRNFTLDVSTLQLEEGYFYDSYNSIMESLVLSVKDDHETGFGHLPQTYLKNLIILPLEVSFNIVEEHTGVPIKTFRVFNPNVFMPSEYLLKEDQQGYQGDLSPFSNISNIALYDHFLNSGTGFNSSALKDTPYLRNGLLTRENSFQYIEGVTRLSLKQGTNFLAIWTEDHYAVELFFEVSPENTIIDVILSNKSYIDSTNIKTLVTDVGSLTQKVDTLYTEVEDNTTICSDGLTEISTHDTRVDVALIKSVLNAVNATTGNINTIVNHNGSKLDNLTLSNDNIYTQVNDNEAALNQVIGNQGQLRDQSTQLSVDLNSLTLNVSTVHNDVLDQNFSLDNILDKSVENNDKINLVLNAQGILQLGMDSSLISMDGLKSDVGEMETKLVQLTVDAVGLSIDHQRLTSDLAIINSDVQYTRSKVDSVHGNTVVSNGHLISVINGQLQDRTLLIDQSDSLDEHSVSLLGLTTKVNELAFGLGNVSLDVSNIYTDTTTISSNQLILLGKEESNFNSISIQLTQILNSLPIGNEILQVLNIVSDPLYGNQVLKGSLDTKLTKVDFLSALEGVKGSTFSSTLDSLGNLGIMIRELLDNVITVSQIWEHSSRSLTDPTDLIVEIRQQLNRIETNIDGEILFDKLHTPTITGS